MPTFRKLLRSEVEELQSHYLRLDRADRTLRFFSGVSDGVIITRCQHLDWRRAHIVGAFVDGTLRGVAELQLETPYLSRHGELAVSVEKPWQGQGIGTELLRRALVIARNRAVRSLTMACLLDNQPMQRVARKFADELQLRDGTVEADIAMPFPSYFSLWQESTADGIGYLDAMLGVLSTTAKSLPFSAASGRTA